MNVQIYEYNELSNVRVYPRAKSIGLGDCATQTTTTDNDGGNQTFFIKQAINVLTSPKHLVKVSAISVTKTVNTEMYIFGLDVTS